MGNYYFIEEWFEARSSGKEYVAPITKYMQNKPEKVASYEYSYDNGIAYLHITGVTGRKVTFSTDKWHEDIGGESKRLLSFLRDNNFELHELVAMCFHINSRGCVYAGGDRIEYQPFVQVN